MENTEIKAVVFDYGGVICYPPSQEAEGELARLIGLNLNALRELNNKHRSKWDRGTYNGTEYYRFILSEAGIFPDDDIIAKIALTDMDGWKRINPETVQLMRDIKASGITLGILSNMPYDFLAWALEIPVFKEVDIGIFSCAHNLVKPEEGIFKTLRERCGCEYGEIVFFVFFRENVSKAEELGIRSFLWEGAGKAGDLLSNLIKGLTIS
jgi:putative hydrolase of the HAD superfamily